MCWTQQRQCRLCAFLFFFFPPSSFFFFSQNHLDQVQIKSTTLNSALVFLSSWIIQDFVHQSVSLWNLTANCNSSETSVDVANGSSIEHVETQFMNTYALWVSQMLQTLIWTWCNTVVWSCKKQIISALFSIYKNAEMFYSSLSQRLKLVEKRLKSRLIQVNYRNGTVLKVSLKLFKKVIFFKSSIFFPFWKNYLCSKGLFRKVMFYFPLQIFTILPERRKEQEQYVG